MSNKSKIYTGAIVISLIIILEIVNVTITYKNMSSIISVSDTGNVNAEENVANPMPFIRRTGENNYRSAPLFPFRSPFRLIIAGPSGAGKTAFIQRLLRESKLNDPTTP